MSWLHRIFGNAGTADGRTVPDGCQLLREAFHAESLADVAKAASLYRSVPEGTAAHAQATFYLARLAGNDRRRLEALTLYQQAAEARPDDALYQLALGDALVRERRFQDALEAYGACRDLQIEETVMVANYAGALIELDRREEARVELERLREIAPYAPEIHFNLGGIYREYCRTDEAIACYSRALELDPSISDTYSNLLLELNMSATRSAQAVFEEHRRFGEHFAKRYTVPVPDRTWPRRLRIGYVSADFRAHVVSFFMEPILARHDHERFEIFCYHTHGAKDSFTQALRPLADHFIDCEDLSNAELAERIGADRIDILIDLGGHTAHNRLLAFTRKPAPVQATYLGYPNTTGLTTIDYHISDATADPPGSGDALNTERVIRLPNSYFCYRPGADAPEVAPLPAEGSGTITFGCFNHFAKVSPAYLDTVARVLQAVPNSRFLLKGRPLSFPEVADKVRLHFSSRGVDAGRLDLRGWEATPFGHLKIYGAVDIVLDTFPYSGATSACEALWMGASIVTFAGDRHSSRMCASILRAVGLGEWVANDQDEYVEKSASLAKDVARLAELRRSMRDRMRASPLMNETQFTRDLERVFVQMWERSVVSPPLEAAGEKGELEKLLGEARTLVRSGKPMEAVQASRRVLARFPDHKDALEVLWDAAFAAGAPGTAIDPLVRAIALQEDSSRFQYMLGCCLEAQGKALDAIEAFRRAVELEPRFAKGHNNLGCALEAVGQLEEAGKAYAAASELDPALAMARYNLGNLRHRLGVRSEAIEYLQQALALEPANPVWHCRLAETLYEDQQYDEALRHFERACQLDPADGRPQRGLGQVLATLGRVEEALGSLRRALQIEPSNAALESQVVDLELRTQGHKPEVVLENHLAWSRRHARGLMQFTTGAPKLEAGQRINVGYVAGDIAAHDFASFVLPVLAAHDREKFDVFCYSGVAPSERAAQALAQAGCSVRDLSSATDLQAVDRIRADSIHILVDLAGHAPGGRPTVFARRAAHVQIAWPGYPGTTGLRALDYRISDSVVSPDARADQYSVEKLIRLSQGACYLPQDPHRPADAPMNASVTFASFADLACITEDMIRLWSRVLQGVPGGCLRLHAPGLQADSARRRILKLFQDNGISGDRLHLPSLERSPRQGGLAARPWRGVDVFLDTFPYSDRVALCEALWNGVPVVSLAGESDVSRIGAGILAAAGLVDWIADTAQAYVDIAARLAGRRSGGAGLQTTVKSAPLADVSRFTGELEDTYRRTLAQWRRQSIDRQHEEPFRLHIGGKEPRRGWKILNVKPGPGVDFIGDCSKDLGQFSDASVDEIYASHVLEHLGYHRALPATLREFHRILKPGGSARIGVPDFERLCGLFLDPALSKEERFAIMRMAFGGQMDEHDVHYVGLSWEFLRDYLLQAGFSRVERVQEFGLFNDSSRAVHAGRAISLNVIAYK